MQHPTFRIRSSSIGSVGLWSLLMGMATPCREATHLVGHSMCTHQHCAGFLYRRIQYRMETCFQDSGSWSIGNSSCLPAISSSQPPTSITQAFLISTCTLKVQSYVQLVLFHNATHLRSHLTNSTCTQHFILQSSVFSSDHTARGYSFSRYVPTIQKQAHGTTIVQVPAR